MSDKNVKKKLSGCEYRKRKAEKEKYLQENKKFMNIEQYVIQKKQSNTLNNLEEVIVENSIEKNTINDSVISENVETAMIGSLQDHVEAADVQETTNEICDNNMQKQLKFELSDCGTWPNFLNGRTVDCIIKNGATQIMKNKYPKNKEGRHFSNSYYTRKLSNGESFRRQWLVYSISKNCVFCFCCRLFDKKLNSNFINEGCNKWKHLSELIKSHENSVSHVRCYQQWKEIEIRMKTETTIDLTEQKLIEKESLRWQNVLNRLMNIVAYLSANNMSFRGNSDKLYTRNNGKFLGLVELLAKFDPIMQNHVTLAMKGDISDHYCGKRIQNELIDLMANKVNKMIIIRALKAKYYSIIADCTPDVSHVEQLSLTVRFVDVSDDTINIKEHFLKFIPINDSSGSGLTEILIEELTKHALEIINCEGQGYDNGSNMKGKNNGVQKKILNLNPLATYVPCGSHSLNLVLCDAATSSIKSVTLFGILQRLFTLFSASVNRWKILTDHISNMTLKKLSDTRWEAKINSVKAVRYQISEIYDALITLSESEKCDPSTWHEAITLAEQLQDFSFIVSLIVWYNVLFQINVASKMFQAKDMDIAECTQIMRNCNQYLKNYRINGLKQAIIEAKDLAQQLNIEPVFKSTKRIRRVKRHYDDITEDEPIISPEKKFEIDFFNCLLDTVIASMTERFKQLSAYSQTWGFLYNLNNLPGKEELLKLCINLQTALTVNSSSDINGTLLCDELISIQSFIDVKNHNKIDPIFILNFIKNKDLLDLYSNIWIAMRILLTIPVTVASGERSFSKLKLIKTYLRSKMSQERLSSLATLSIENDIVENLDFTELRGYRSSAPSNNIFIQSS